MIYGSLFSDAEVFVEASLRKRVVTTLGGKPSDYSFLFDDFTFMTLDAGTKKSTPIGWSTLVNPDGVDWNGKLFSHLRVDDKMRIERQFGYMTYGSGGFGPYWGPLTSRRWMLAMNLKNYSYQVNGNVGFELSTGTYDDTRAGIWLFGHATGGVYYGHGGQACYGGAIYNDSRWVQGTVGTVPMISEEGAGDPHVLYLFSRGDGTYQAQLDNGAISTPVSYNPDEVLDPDDNPGVRFVTWGGLGLGDIDWLFFAVAK